MTRSALLVLAACSSSTPARTPIPVGGDPLFRSIVDQRVWETWPTSDVALGKRDRMFRAPVPPTIDDEIVAVEKLPVMFTVLFDPSSLDHVRTVAHRRTLELLGEMGGTMPEFPKTSIALKLVWYPIKAHGVTAMPEWDPDTAPIATGNPDDTWTRAIAVDPSSKIGATSARVTLLDREFEARVVPLSAFVHRRLSTMDEVRAARRAARDPSIAIGDHVALVAVHATTKAVPAWTWSTYWWQGGTYRALACNDATKPCFNPWLEARFPDGMHSNCLACHQRAVFGQTEYLPVTRALTPDDDPYFAGRVQTDFLWSIALEAP